MRRTAHSVWGILRAFAVSAVLAVAPGGVWAEPGDLVALARIDADASRIEDFGSDLQVELALSQPVPWRVFTLDDPRRLVADFAEVDFAGVDLARIVHSDLVGRVIHGRLRDGWSRLVVELSEPLKIETAGLGTGGAGALSALKLSLAPTSDKDFADSVGAPESGLFVLPDPQEMIDGPQRQTGDRPLRVVLDPGHGGIDPGAEVDGLTEADVILEIALQLAAGLRHDGHVVSLTRETDTFVPLARRVSIARAAEADIFISLHADALAEGRASGATVYTLSDEATDLASQKLAEHHDRADLVAGVDLQQHGDEIAVVLMDVARMETTPRSERLAQALVDGLARHTGDLHKRPRLKAGFSVLMAPDIPSVLLELGFLSSARDRSNLSDPVWRANTIKGICEAVLAWAREDAAETALLRH